MGKTNIVTVMRQRRAKRVRKHLSGATDRPRLRVTRSIKHIYAQIIDDTTGRTLAAASSIALKIDGGAIEGARQVGKAIGDRAREISVNVVCFDRGGRLYHGRVKALADAAREAGLQF